MASSKQFLDWSPAKWLPVIASLTDIAWMEPLVVRTPWARYYYRQYGGRWTYRRYLIFIKREISKEDVFQQLALWALYARRLWSKRQKPHKLTPKAFLRKYLTRALYAWVMRVCWYRVQGLKYPSVLIGAATNQFLDLSNIVCPPTGSELSGLDQDSRYLLYLRWVEGLGSDEIGRKLGRDNKGVRMILNATLKRLRENGLTSDCPGYSS